MDISISAILKRSNTLSIKKAGRSKLFFGFRGIICYTIIVIILCLVVSYKHVEMSAFLGFLKQIKNSSGDTAGSKEEDNTGNAFSVHTSNCKIPNFNPGDGWGNESDRFNRGKCLPNEYEDPNCLKKAGRIWMYVEDVRYLRVNLSALHESGYNWESNQLYCCYRVILRGNGLGKYNDVTVTLSNKCHRIRRIKTEMKEEFIRIFCYSISNPFQFMDVLYRGYFAFAIASSHVKDKIRIWKDVAEAPPNVIILGVDTNSRLNTRKWLPKTVDLLLGNGAIEMLGYTKENTLPNTIPFVAGMHLSEMDPYYCRQKFATHDKCPYIWKMFDRAGYLTAMAEDTPYLTSFNHDSFGFENRPVDFYYRPFSYRIAKRGPREQGWTVKCIGGYQAEVVLYNYISDILLRVSDNAPTFVFTWLTQFSHQCAQSVRFQDDSIFNFLKRIFDATNSIVFFMSDHGERYGPFRKTALGWYQDKLPTMWVYLPPKIRGKFPNWIKNLETNSKRLTSPFDVYHTFTNILDAFDVNKSLNVYESIPNHFGKKGYTLFEQVPENRTCEDAGISSAFCACSEPKTLDLADVSVYNLTLNAINASLLYLKANLPEQCAVLALKKIESVKFTGTKNGPATYVINVCTDPGDFQFEFSVRKTSKPSLFVVDDFSNILRLDKMKGNFDCVSSTVLQRYCYCK